MTKTTEYAGIDYSLGNSNFDPKTGIHFGVIALNSICQAWCDESDPIYGAPHCPHCGEELTEDMDIDELEACPHCGEEFDGCEEFCGESVGCEYVGEGMAMASAFDGAEIFVTLSPFFTYAQFCSPCAPGAGNLDSYCPDGPKTYCPSHDWFEEGKAPYPVYSVETGELVIGNPIRA